MDCVQVSEILSAAHDGEAVGDIERAEAHRHCETCASCATFADTLARLGSLPAPAAPDELVSRLVSIGAQAAEEIRESEIAARALAEAGLDAGLAGAAVSAPAQRRLLPEWWAPRFTAFAAAAAVLLVTLGAGGVAMVGLLGADREDGSTMMSLESPESAPAAAPDDEAYRAQGTGDAAASDSTALADGQSQTAPSYVVFERGVWLLSATADVAPSTLTTAGVVTSSLGTAGEPSEHTALVSADRETLWVSAEGGTYLLFSRVVRTLGLARYALVSDIGLARFGQWPGLPSTVQTPQSPDGSPTLIPSGFDDLGRTIYIPLTGRVEQGFALPPGMPPDDPAAANPNWTWWEPVR